MAWWRKYPIKAPTGMIWTWHQYSLHRMLFCVPGDIIVSQSNCSSLIPLKNHRITFKGVLLIIYSYSNCTEFCNILKILFSYIYHFSCIYHMIYTTWFPNFDEIYHKKMFAYFQVALGQFGSGNIVVLCLDRYDTMQISIFMHKLTLWFGDI